MVASGPGPRSFGPPPPPSSSGWGRLDPGGITLQGVTARRFAWPQVRAIQPTRYLGDRRTEIVLRHGTSVKTHAPIHSWIAPDPEFDAKVAAMQQYHMAHMGPPHPF